MLHLLLIVFGVIFSALYGLGIGLAFRYITNPGAYGEADPWKFGYGYSLTLIIVLLASTRAAAARRH